MKTLSASAVAPSALPDTLPLFPLSGVVLLPRAKLPLNIFEPRYLAMVEDALAAPGRLIGMVQPRDAESMAPAPPVYSVGCAGRITSFNETEDGRFLVSLTGVSRFEIAEEMPMEQPYRRAKPNWQKFLPDLEPETPADIDRKRLAAALRVYFQMQNIDADWNAVQQTPDALLVSSLVMICPLAPNERQALLEAADSAARADLLIALLEMAMMPQAVEAEGGARH